MDTSRFAMAALQLCGSQTGKANSPLDDPPPFSRIAKIDRMIGLDEDNRIPAPFGIGHIAGGGTVANVLVPISKHVT